MKIAQELRAGTVIKIGSDVLIVQKADYSKSGRNSAVVKLKFKNLLTGASTETVLKASDKVEDIRLEKKKMAFSYADGTSYAFQDQVTWDQVDLTEDDLGDALRYLEEKGVEVTYLPVNKDGSIDLQKLKSAIKPNTKLVSIMTVNNEIGVKYPLEEIGKICKEKEIVFHN